MRDVIVAIDLETTGLDVAEAQIIEIGAVKFREHEILETYNTLVDPGSPVPAKVTAITHIRQKDIVGAPKIADVLPTLTAFIGDALLLGHNIDFDLRFFHKQGVLTNNSGIDTYELASVLLPTTPRYNLNALMQALNLSPEGNFHRALADAMATARVYMALWDKLITSVPVGLLREIITLAQNLPWRAQPIFSKALEERERSVSGSQPESAWPVELFKSAAPLPKPRQPSEKLTPLSAEQLSALVASKNPLLSTQQSEIVGAVSEAFNSDGYLMLEVPAGVDESLAYLLPAVKWAADNRDRVVIATASDESQIQLLSGPLTQAQQMLGVNVEAVQLKNREYYLCPSRLSALRRRLPTSIEELRVLAKTLYWLCQSDQPSGNRSEISLRGPAEYSAWARLSAQDEECTLERCQTQNQGICPFYKACHAADSAPLVLLDHTLLLADASTSSPLVPPYRRAILDEAHHLEENITYGLRFWTDATAIKRRLADLGTLKTGLLGNVIKSTRGVLPTQSYEQVRIFVANIAAAATKMEYHIDTLFTTLRRFLETTENLRPGDFLQQIRLTRQVRARSAFGPVQAAWDVLSQFTETIGDAMTRLSQQLTTLRGRYAITDLEDLIAGTNAAGLYLTKIHAQLKAMIAAPDENTAYWVELPQDSEHFSIHSAPIQVGPLIDKYLWSAKQTVIMVSTALRAGGSFAYIRNRFNAEKDKVREMAVVSPLDYRQSTLIYLPSDMPEPNERERYQKAVERGIIELATATNGRLMALFTSFTQLRQSSQNITARLALGNIMVFDQSDGSSQQALLEGFRSTPHAVLLGSRGFWEASDLSIDELAALVIVRLPFGVPSDPLIAARGEAFDDAFNEYMAPDAILRFRQGAAWLIRNRRDRGVVAIFDKRMISKDYGRLFLESLPSCTVRQEPLADLASTAKQWLIDTSSPA